MKRFLGGIALIGLLAGTAEAQLASAPVWYSPAFGSGVGIFADFSTGLNDDAKFDTSAPMAFGGKIVFGASAFKMWAGANYVNTKDDDLKKPVSFGGNLGVTIYKGAGSPIMIDLMAGVGYVKYQDTVLVSESKWLNFPIGLPISYGAVLSGGSMIEPWIAPILQIYSVDDGTVKETDMGFGVAGGINFYSAMGLGAYVNLDWQSVKFGVDPASFTWKPLRLGAGLSWKFSVPSLPAGSGLVGG